MDWQALASTYPTDRDLPSRASRLAAFDRVLSGTQYDAIVHPFSREQSGGGEYIPLDQRRPSVRTNLCRVVVEDAVSLLFSEGHWPAIRSANDEMSRALARLVRETALNQTMIDAATRGSIGSVCIRFRALRNKPFFDVLSTIFLTPTWDPEDPKRLVKVTERYKVKGRDLTAQGYPIPYDEMDSDFWFTREWTETDETWFVPQKVRRDDRSAPVVDASRSVNHGLGFVPLLWIRNLTGDGPDGACTFEPAIDTVIECDYLLSQAGRGLKYSSDPTLVLKEGPALPGEQVRVGGAASALVVPPEGDAKLLEINGRAAEVVIQHVRELRAIALEAVHGNRAPSERMSSPQSGRAMEMSLQGLIWLADRLRISYGEGGLLPLLRMACEASVALEGGLIVGGQAMRLDPSDLELRWPAWLPPMPQDLLTTSQALVTATAGHILSDETAVVTYASMLGVDDADAELTRVRQDMADAHQQALATAQASAVRQDANVGKVATRQETA